ncbi:hypothetical protein [Xanthobacter aminoxidans]|uniref:hypothetical protein n=1 Tax=Xanthobacter aminoxidans TaxID=186280 RepID=UPI00372B4F0D
MLRSDICFVEENPGFLKPIGITSERAYRPWVIQPNLEVWQEICRKINRESAGRAQGRSSLLKLADDKTGPLFRYSFTIRFYRPGIICIEVQLLDEIGDQPSDFFRNRNFHNHLSASMAAQILLGILASGQTKNYHTLSSFSARPAMLYAAPTSRDRFEEWKQENKALLVGLLLNIPHYESSSDEFVNNIFGINKEINVKYAKGALSIVSKQGVLTVYPNEGSDLLRDIEREHARRFRFLEYALVLQNFLEHFQKIRVADKIKAEFLLFLSTPFLRGDANLPRTVTGSNTWKILSDEFSLSRSLSALESVYIEESKSQEKYYTKLKPEVYGSLGYMDEVSRVTKRHRNWVLRDLSDKKLLTLLLTIIGVLLAGIKLITG